MIKEFLILNSDKISHHTGKCKIGLKSQLKKYIRDDTIRTH